VLVAGQLPVGPHGLGVDTGAELAECGVGVDCDDAVILAQFGEHRADAGRDGGLADTALAHDADLVVSAQAAADARLEFGLADLVGRRPQVDQAEAGAEQRAPPTARR
jgi:hypothetical protein